jgi:hypothetical protein
LCELAGCREQDVWCVPGNHDIDQDVFDNSILIRMLHDRLRVKNPDEVDERLAECLRDTAGAVEFFRPLQNYNNFAAIFSCKSQRDPLAWRHELDLNDNSKLRIIGANSTLISHKSDNNADRRLILGTIQSRPTAPAGVINLLMCHHPPDWLQDYDNVNMNLDARVKVQLFGHKHLQTIDERNSCVRIVAGAVHPSRKEQQWKPRYNWLVLSVSGEDTDRRLEVDIYPRVWSDARPEYIADVAPCPTGQDHKIVSLRLEPWTAPAAAAPAPFIAAGATADPVTTASVAQGDPKVSERGKDMDAARTLTYRFLSLSHVARIEVAQKLALLDDSDEGLMDFDLFGRIFERAMRQQKLESLWELVEAVHGDGHNPRNLYVGQ